MKFTTAEIALATKGRVVGPDVEVADVTTDSRYARRGSLFIPIVRKPDGHDFIADAADAGASAYLTAYEAVVDVTATAVVVDDTTLALNRLARAARERLPEAVIGITGSVGKTSVKDLLAAALATTFRTTASPKNFNNELGVPLTLINAPADTEVLVQEMGARGIGHIDHLCSIARPTSAIITTVAAVHTSEFGSLEAIALGKGELVESIPGDGYVVLNANDKRVLAMRSRTDAEIITFGVSGDVRATAVEVDDELRPSFRLTSPWGKTEIRLNVHGVHHVANALAASAAALAQGVPIEALADGLAAATLSAGRMQFHRLASGAVVIDDTYNASPISVDAALHALCSLDADRHIAVLGAMAELGPESPRLHRAIGRLAKRLDIDVIAVNAPDYDTDTHVADVSEAVAVLGELGEGDAVLVKASRSAALERVVRRLIKPS